jgi:drug/metabolite transporter (DMT)-like permease
MPKEDLKAFLAWINVCVIWGTTYLVIRIGVQRLPPMLFAGIRWIIAGSIFIVFMKWKGKALPKANEIVHLAIVGLALLGLGNGLVVVSEQWIPSGLTALLLSTVPFGIVGLESLLPKGPKLNLTIITGLIMGLLGVFLIFEGEVKYLLVVENRLGILGIMMAVFFWSLGSIYSKYKKVNVHPLMGASVQMLVAGTAMAIVGISLGELPKINLEMKGFLSLAYLITVGSWVGYGSYIYAIAHLPLSLVATHAYVNPIIALFLGWLILDEELNLQIVIAAVVILVGVSIVRHGSAQRKGWESKRT